MKRFELAIWFAAAMACSTAVADAVATTARLAVFDLDTRGVAYSVVSRAEPVALPYGDGATVTATAPGGAVTTLPAAVNGTNYWTATTGGIWTLANSDEGTATFAVRYTQAEQGAGTAESPWKLVDNDELAGLAVSDGFTVSLEGTLASFAKMTRPAGYSLVALGDGKYRFATAVNGAVSSAQAEIFPLDTVETGPDRTVRQQDRISLFAYSGDDWAFSPDARSEISFVSPKGVETTTNCVGTGVCAYQMRGSGVWTVSLSGDGVSTLVSHINYIGLGCILIVE